MRAFVTMLTAAAILCGAAWTVWAQDPAPKAPPPDAKKVDVKAIAELRAKLHRTTADLIEAQVADSPDKEKIEALTKEVQKLRGELRAQRPGFPPGGPGMGPGPGWGRGPGYGRGYGYGRGPGWGRGAGPAPGWGPGFMDEDEDGVCDRMAPPGPPPAEEQK